MKYSVVYWLYGIGKQQCLEKTYLKVNGYSSIAIFTKGNNFCDFLIVFLGNIAFPNWVNSELTHIEKGRKMKLANFFSPESVFVHLNP